MARTFLYLGVGMLLIAGLFCGTVSAHDSDPISIDLDSLSASYEFPHEDEDPWKGSLTVSVTNTGQDPWGDFHFEITSWNGSDISAVDFLEGIVDMSGTPTDTTPTIAGDISSYSYAIDNNVTGATLDYYFYGDPLNQNESATFTFYTDNTATNAPWFGICMHPTPVPEPSMLCLLGIGVAALTMIRRRK